MTNAMKTLVINQLPLTHSHLIEASAGTGKTYSIVRIYLRLLLERELSIDEILVMTFTKAATAELRSRMGELIRDTLTNWSTSTDPTIVYLRNNIETLRAKQLLERALLQLDDAAIYTIHGFCKRALTQQAFLSGMSFQANMEAESNTLLLQATKDWYRTLQNQDEFAAIFNEWPSPDQFVKHWQQVIKNQETWVEPEAGDITLSWQQFAYAWPQEREAFSKLNIQKSRTNKALLESYQQRFDALAAEKPSDFQSIELPSDIASKCFNTANKQQGMASAFAFVQALKHYQKVQSILAALSGIRFIQQRIAEEKGRLDQLDFDDLIQQLKLALQGDQAERLSLELRQQFKAALIDEFQDTDPDQYAILNAIYPPNSDHFICMIGDPKQAIYGFRGGDVFAYLQARNNVQHQWTMNENFRSAQSVVNGYNRLFLGDESVHNEHTFGFGIGYQQVIANKPDIEYSDAATHSAFQWVNIVPTDANPKGENKGFQHTIARWCTSEILRLINKTQFDGKSVVAGDIAILVRNWSEAETMQSILSDHGLASVYLSTRDNVYESDAAQSLLALLTGIWNLENDRCFIAALASQWIALNDAQLDAIQHSEHEWAQWQERFEQWRADWQQRGLMSLLLQIMQQYTRVDERQLDRQLTNMLHLAELLQQESSRYRTPDALLHWYTQTLQQPQTEAAAELRLESDDHLIKIVTMHGAKGLEYPIVFIPFASYGSKGPKQAPAMYRYHDRNDFSARMTFLPTSIQQQMSDEENAAELVRLFYVAVTRAVKRAYICLAPFAQFKTSPIAQTLKVEAFKADNIREKVQGDQTSIGWLQVHEDDITLTGTVKQHNDILVKPAQFTGYIERNWWLSSFSSLTRHLNHSGQSTPDRDEQDVTVVEPAHSLPLRFRLQKGATAGNLLHDTLEQLDFTQPDFSSAFDYASKRYGSLVPEENQTLWRQEFSEWMTDILQAPLATGGRLAQLTTAQTLRESEFYFPMHGQRAERLAEIIRQHRDSAFELPEHHTLKGMMHGFIDLIFEHEGKFYVADYKSTYLGSQLNDYHQEAMQANIEQNHYDVQYAIYALALHRYLRVRISDYTPERHFGGVYYFYLRGMTAEQPTGVYFRAIHRDFLDALDAVFEQPARSQQ